MEESDQKSGDQRRGSHDSVSIPGVESRNFKPEVPGGCLPAAEGGDE